MNSICKWIEIDDISQLKAPLFLPWEVNYKCKGFGYFFNKTTGYGYMGKNSKAKNFYNKWQNIILNRFGYYAVWKCDGSGKWTIKKI